MDYQLLFNIVLGLATAMGGWIFKNMWGSIEELRTQNKDLQLLLVGEYSRKEEAEIALNRVLEKITRLESLEVILHSQYVRKDDFAKTIDNFSAKLDKLMDRLEGKADK